MSANKQETDRKWVLRVHEELLASADANKATQQQLITALATTIARQIDQLLSAHHKGYRFSQNQDALQAIVTKSVISQYRKAGVPLYQWQLPKANWLLEEAADEERQLLLLYLRALFSYMEAVPTVYTGSDYFSTTDGFDVALSDFILPIEFPRYFLNGNMITNIRRAVLQGKKIFPSTAIDQTSDRYNNSSTVAKLAAHAKATVRELAPISYWLAPAQNMQVTTGNSHDQKGKQKRTSQIVADTGEMTDRQLYGIAETLTTSKINQLYFILFNNYYYVGDIARKYIDFTLARLNRDQAAISALWTKFVAGEDDTYQLADSNDKISKHAGTVGEMLKNNQTDIVFGPGQNASRRVYAQEGKVFIRQLELYHNVMLFSGIQIERQDMRPLFIIDVTVEINAGVCALREFRIYAVDPEVCKILFGNKQLSKKNAWVDNNVLDEIEKSFNSSPQVVNSLQLRSNFTDDEWKKIYVQAIREIDLTLIKPGVKQWLEVMIKELAIKYNDIAESAIAGNYLQLLLLIIDFMQYIIKEINNNCNINSQDTFDSYMAIIMTNLRSHVRDDREKIQEFITSLSFFCGLNLKVDSPAYLVDEASRTALEQIRFYLIDICFYDYNRARAETSAIERQIVLQRVFQTNQLNEKNFQNTFVGNGIDSFQSFMINYLDDQRQSRAHTYCFLFEAGKQFDTKVKHADQPWKLFTDFAGKEQYAECLQLIHLILSCIEEKQAEQHEHRKFDPRRLSEAGRGKLFTRLMLTWLALALNILKDSDLMDYKLKQGKQIVRIINKDQIDMLIPKVLLCLESLVRLADRDFAKNRSVSYEHARLLIQQAIFAEYQRVTDKPVIATIFSIAAMIIRAKQPNDYLTVLAEFDVASKLKIVSRQGKELRARVNLLRPLMLTHLANQQQFGNLVDIESLKNCIRSSIEEIGKLSKRYRGIKACTESLISLSQSIITMIHILQHKCEGDRQQDEDIIKIIQTFLRTIYDKSATLLQEFIYYKLAVVIAPIAKQLERAYAHLHLPESLHHAALLIDMGLVNDQRFDAERSDFSDEICLPVIFDPRLANPLIKRAVQREYSLTVTSLHLQLEIMLPKATKRCHLVQLLKTTFKQLMYDPITYAKLCQNIWFQQLLSHVSESPHVVNMDYILTRLKDVAKLLILTPYSKQILVYSQRQVEDYHAKFNQYIDLISQNKQTGDIYNGYVEYLIYTCQLKRSKLKNNAIYLMFVVCLSTLIADKTEFDKISPVYAADMLWMTAAQMRVLPTDQQKISDFLQDNKLINKDYGGQQLVTKLEQLNMVLTFLVSTSQQNQVVDTSMDQLLTGLTSLLPNRAAISTASASDSTHQWQTKIYVICSYLFYGFENFARDISNVVSFCEALQQKPARSIWKFFSPFVDESSRSSFDLQLEEDSNQEDSIEELPSNALPGNG